MFHKNSFMVVTVLNTNILASTVFSLSLPFANKLAYALTSFTSNNF